MGKKKDNLTSENLLIQGIKQPYRIPSNWCWSKIEVLYSVNPKNQADDNMTASFIPMEKIAGGFISDFTYDVQEWGKAKKAHTQFADGDVAFAKISPCFENRKSMIITGLENGIGAGTTELIVLRQPLMNQKYTYYYVSNEEFINGGKATYSGTVGQQRISMDYVRNYPVPVPPLAEQKRIVEQIENLFSKLNDTKEKIISTIAESVDRKNAILEYAFSGKMTADWRRQRGKIENTTLQSIAEYTILLPNKDKKKINECQESCEKYVLSDGTVWYKTIIGAVGVVTNGSTPTRKCNDYWRGNIPWVSSGEVRNNIIESTREYITQEGFNNSSVKLLPAGTVLIAMIGEGKTRGQSAVLSIEATTNQNIAAIVLNHGFVNPKFLWYWLQKEYRRNREKGAGSGPQALNCQRVRELEFMVPSLDEQNEIVKIIEMLMDKEEQILVAMEEVVDKITDIEKSILAKAFRGELGTNVASEESSLELLKTIIN